MSFRYKLNLTNKKTKESSYLQIFGNNDSFNYFTDYLKKFNPNIDYDDEVIEPIKITNIVELVRAIDETVYYTFIEGKENECNIFNFTKSFFTQYTNEPMPYISLYGLSSLIFNNSYLTTSYNVIEWLKANNALVDIHIRPVEHSYLKNNDYVLIGDLNPNFELTISYS